MKSSFKKSFEIFLQKLCCIKSKPMSMVFSPSSAQFAGQISVIEESNEEPPRYFDYDEKTDDFDTFHQESIRDKQESVNESHSDINQAQLSDFIPVSKVKLESSFEISEILGDSVEEKSDLAAK